MSRNIKIWIAAAGIIAIPFGAAAYSDLDNSPNSSQGELLNSTSKGVSDDAEMKNSDDSETPYFTRVLKGLLLEKNEITDADD